MNQSMIQLEVGAPNQPYSDKSEEVETSSDEPYGNQNTKIKKSENDRYTT